MRDEFYTNRQKKLNEFGSCALIPSVAVLNNLNSRH